MNPSKHYIPSLDGLRAVSITLVLLSHFGLQKIVPGGFGVTVFFFISGLLITGQLLAEFGRSRRINLPAFAMRRLLRLYPAMLVMVALGCLAFHLLGGLVTPTQVMAALLYGTNYLLLLGGLESGVAHDYHPLSILWSLAIEEHFYLMFPLFLLLTARLRRVGTGLILAIVAVSLWRLHVVAACATPQGLCIGGGVADRVAFGTDTRIDGILYGSLLALVAQQPRWQRALCSPAAPAIAGVLLLAGFLIRDPWFRATLIYTAQGIGLFCGIGWLLGAARATRLRHALSWRPVILVGRWSYSLYLWHWVVVVCAGAWLPGGLGELTGEGRPGLFLPRFLPALLAASLLLACGSYYLVERPMLRLRRRFGSMAENIQKEQEASASFGKEAKLF